MIKPTYLFSRLLAKRSTGLKVVLPLAVLYAANFHFAPLLLSPRIADLESRQLELTVLQGQEELILEGLSSGEEPLELAIESERRWDLELDFARAELAQASAASFRRAKGEDPPGNFPRIHYFSHPLPSASGEPCPTNFSLSADEPLQSLRLSQPEIPSSDRFRLIQVYSAQQSLTAHLSFAAWQPNRGPLGLGCTRQLNVGSIPWSFGAPFTHVLTTAAGSDIRLQFERLSPPEAPDDLWPVSLLDQMDARAVRIVGTSDGRDRALVKGRSGKPTIRLASLRLGTDRMRITISGDGLITNHQTFLFAEGFKHRPTWATLWLALNGGCFLFLAMSLRTIRGNEEFAEDQKGPPVRIFVSYSHDDSAYMKEILGFLEGLEREGIELWTDKEIVGGDRWSEVIQEQIERSDMVLALVSQSFLDSRFCTDVEVRGFLAKSAILVPVILSPCLWDNHAWLASRQALPGGAETLDHYQESVSRKQHLVDLRKHLLTQAARIRQERGRKRRWLRVLPPFFRRRSANAA